MRWSLLLFLSSAYLGLATDVDKRSISSGHAIIKKTETVEGSGDGFSSKSGLSDDEVHGSGSPSRAAAFPDDEDSHVEGSGNDEVEGSGRESVFLTTPRSFVDSATTSRSFVVPFTTTTTHVGVMVETAATQRPWEIQTAATTTTASATTSRSSTSTTISFSTTSAPPRGKDGEEKDAPTSPFHNMLRPGIFAAVVGGAVVGLLTAVLLVMFIVHRMRKKDEGSYALEEPKPRPYPGYAYTKASTKEFYA